MKVIAEYLWLDGKNLVKDKEGKVHLDSNKNPDVRGKTKVLDVEEGTTLKTLQVPSLEFDSRIPIWGFDGSSTNQAEGHASDCVLKPVKVYRDPFRTRMRPDYLSVMVLNEVMYVPGDQPHLSNTRALLRVFAEKYKEQLFWFGFEQEYTFMRVADGKPLGFPKGEGNFPEPQGKYYCAVGADRIVGRKMVEEHLFACLDADLVFAGINAEVMPGQWEYQMGNGTPASGSLRVTDDLTVARYLMTRIGEEYGVVPSLVPKPVKGDWNGAGMHTNFSTTAMRESDACFEAVIASLQRNHEAHIAVYGEGIQDRLTGAHETCRYDTFRWGVSDRGASIREPWQVAAHKKGYLEDRRPCANADPYVVAAKIIETVMEK